MTDETYIYNFWNRVDIRRKQRGLSLKDLSEKISVSYAVLKGQRTRNSLPKTMQIYEMAHSLDTSMEYLLTGVRQEVDPISKTIADNPALRDLFVKLMNLSDKQLAAISTVVDSYLPDPIKQQNAG